MKSKLIIYFSIIFLLISSIDGIFIKSVSAALTPGTTITIKDILAYDSNIHPTTRKEVWDLIDRLKANNGSLPDRTGWGAYKLTCKYKDESNPSLGTFWDKWDEVMTSDSGRDKIYSVSDPYYRDQIIAKYGQEVYDAAVSSGENLVYQTDSKTSYTTEFTLWHDDCSPGELGAYYNNSDFYLTLTFTIGGGVDLPSTGGSCERKFVTGPDGSTQNASFTGATPNGSISSNNGQFDVVQGIPSSEYLRTDASSEEYLYNQQFSQRTGNVVFNNIQASKTFTLTWTEEKTTTGTDGKPVVTKTPMSETVTVTDSVSGITRPYSFWEVLGYNIWQLSNARMTNYALPGQAITMPSGVSISANATHKPNVQDHVFPATCPTITLPAGSVSGGTSKPSTPSITSEARAAAEAAVGPNQVENDYATFKGNTIMSNVRATTNGPTPISISSPSRTYMSATNLLIEPLKTNYWQSPSTGNVTYNPVFSLTGSAITQTFSFSVNNVTVHTPTVMYARASDDKAHDQRTAPPTRSTPANPDTDRHAFILDRPFTVSLPTSGQHRNIAGYGNRDYAKYIKEKQVRFPFDVYTETKQGYYPANTWISIPVNQESATFFMPVWVPEGAYTVQFRNIAINDPSLTGGEEKHANTTIPNGSVSVSPAGTQTASHVAIDSIAVDVVGRLYDLQVTDIKDYNWQSVFRQSDGVSATGNSYWVGTKGIDAQTRGNVEQFTLPIRPGSHPEGYKNVAIKKGYSFSFNLKTKGTMFGKDDAIRIKPTFYFVNKNGANRQKVDLYYHDQNEYFIKVGSAKDDVYRTVQLNEVTRNVPETDLIANADIYYRHASDYDFSSSVVNYNATSFARQYLRYLSKAETPTGPYGWQILNWNLRTFIGPTQSEVPSGATMVPKADIIASEQTWYGEYSLPAKVYAVPEGTNLGNTIGLNENHPLFLRDGYIIVNFDIETITNGDLQNPRLQYMKAPLMNQWYDMEGYARSFIDSYGNAFSLLDGDVVFYHGDRSALDDYSPSVTH